MKLIGSIYTATPYFTNYILYYSSIELVDVSLLMHLSLPLPLCRNAANRQMLQRAGQ